LEREKRFKSAGIRTHVLVAMSSALMMIVSKYGFFDVLGIKGISLDASRIAAGVVTAIGFLGAGVIFVRRENTIGVTTAAGLWGTVGLGIAIGAGMYLTGVFFTMLMILLQVLLHNRHLHLGTQLIGTVTVPLDDSMRGTELLGDDLKKSGLSIRNMQVTRGQDGKLLLTANIVFRKKIPIPQAIERLQQIGTVVSVESFTVN
jgi:putative Mg2+ transporter-C (MgtC) family protein